MKNQSDKIQKKRYQSLGNKLILVFSLVFLSVTIMAILFYERSAESIRQMRYDEMLRQAESYLDNYEMEIAHTQNLQLGFFNDRKLPFLAQKEMGLTDYEKRDAMLSIQEKIVTIIEASEFLEQGILFLPKSGYVITQDTIREMSESDLDQMEMYLDGEPLSLQYNAVELYSVQSTEKGNTVEDYSTVFVLLYSEKAIEDTLTLLSQDGKSGAFIYNEEMSYMISSDSPVCAGEKIRKEINIVSDEEQLVQRVRVDGKNYLVSIGGTGVLGTFVQYTEEAPLMEEIRTISKYMLLFLGVLVLISIGVIIYVKHSIHRPIRVLMEAFGRVKEGNLDEKIHHANTEEFAYLYEGFNEMEDRLKQLIDEVYVQQNLVQKAELKQLQAQINPHFLYNSFFTLSRRIKREDYENAEEFCKHLGNYFKYLTRDESDYLTLKQETEHAGSYAEIQRVRFASRLAIEMEELPKRYESFVVPRLILQPLLENSFGHGLENKVSGGLLKIVYKENEKEFQIRVEDNGEEADDEKLMQMQQMIMDINQPEITGIVNVHRRLKSYFDGKAGLRIERSMLGGAAVIIWISQEIIKMQLEDGQVSMDESKSIDRR